MKHSFLSPQRMSSFARDESSARSRRSVVWDYIAVYPRGAAWEASPPEPLYSGGPVVRVIDEARSALSRALNGAKAQHVGPK